MMAEVISVTMRLYHCRECDLSFQVGVAALAGRPARCPGCGQAQTVTPFDERDVPLAVVDGEEGRL